MSDLRKPTILVLGASGTFGRRIVELLVADGRLVVLCGSRDPGRARSIAAELGAAAGVALGRPLDTDTPRLVQLGVDVLVDASGPFQGYGGPALRYGAPRAAIRAGCNYLDLADDPAFVAGIDALDAEARAAGVYVLSGASSFPVLVEAAVRAMAPGFAAIHDVEAGIAPSQRARVGRNVLRAILGYAGQRTNVLADGHQAEAVALASTRRRVIAPPGTEPLAATTFSLFAVPDLVTLPKTGLVTRSVWAGAGPRPQVLHAILRLLARAVSAGLVASLEPLAPLVDLVCGVTARFGRDRGGMYVEVSGLDCDGKRRRRSFDLIAEGADGPMIPAMAVVAILRRHVEGRPPAIGARFANGSIGMEDYDAMFAGRRITYGLRDLG